MPNTMMRSCLVAVLAFAVGRSLDAADLVLVADGKPHAVIVAAAGTNAFQAAVEIQKYLEKMSGAKLPILAETEPNTSGMTVTIAVGHTQLAKKSGVRMPSGFKEVVGDPNVFEEEGFVITTKGNQVILGGNDDGPYQGTIYAAYEFLERLGCRWYFPGAWGEVIPETTTVVVPAIDLTSKPDFALRHVSLGGWIPSSKEERATYADWCRKVKFSSGRFYPGVGDGFLGYLLPPKEYQTNEPTLYAMNKAGSRTQRENFNNGVMLSLVNPRTFELSVQNLRAAFAGTNQSAIKRIVAPNGFGISPPDGAAFDYDPEAVKRNQNFDYPTYVHHAQTSDEFFDFASRLAGMFPDKWVATMAYAGREVPPQGVAIPKNLTVLYAPISTCVLHHGNDPSCWRRSETIMIMRQWCRLTPHVYLYDYNPGFLLGSFVPERDVANFAENVKIYKGMKLKGFQPEGRKAFMQTWISYYVRGKLMWDSKADVEAIKQDFYTTFFGAEAGPHVQQWWDECEKALAATSMHCHEDWLVNHVYTVPFTTRIREHVDKARACAMTPKQKERFELFALIADHLEGFALMEEAEKNLDYVEAAKQAQRMEDDKEKLIAAYSFFMGSVKRREFTNGRVIKYGELAQKTGGEAGTLVDAIPLEASFRRDRFNEGVFAEWYLPAHDASGWETKHTFLTWDAQDKPEDEQGHDYDGYGWYRMTVNVPAAMVSKPLSLHLGGVINEGWVWINGNYAGHRAWKLWWAGRDALEMDVDVTGKVKAGANVIAIRVWNNAEIGGLYRRGFLWSPKP
ncbi:MAG: hypothetical protein A2498_07135 [Lentisphaerae bacterium RIFOXYC12_FULL_60_16]|nr:MAG: hypothetical protein A2498_07135 [Lentisphaerae bacterium RIFOXYC12_FULL_60_16]OGV83753.1 MAG: hypothetical protein A2340_11620 [Lentisphaerae bacterium RIFOXYB12_FULL_60_10]